MTCPSCGAEAADSARFCAMCGRRLAVGCASCGAELHPGTRFCTSCGAPVASSSEVAAEPAAEAPAAERRHVSVLFVDLAGFTSLAERMDPEDVRRIQSRYFEVARSVVATHGGTIEKFIGDAVMAVWGAPVAHEDDAERAVRAALAILYAVDRLGGSAEADGLRARAAVTSGEAVVTIGASGQGMVAGDLVNVAARLQSRAPVGGALVDETTRSLAPRAAEYRRVGTLALKGRAGRLAAYRAVTGSGLPLSRPAGVHLGPFVGRDRELRELQDLLNGLIRDRHGRLVSVTGIAGIGKSRLIAELGSWVDALDAPIAWHDGRSPAYGEGIAFAALAEMVRRRIRVDEGSPPEIVRRQLRVAIDEFAVDAAERRWIEPRLATLLERDETAAFDRDELFAAWRRFFERVADRTPAVLVFEDFQWADPSLAAFVEYLAAWTSARPILIVTVSRPDPHERPAAWGAVGGSSTTLQLERLDDEPMRLLLAHHAPELSDDVVRQILDHAGGVPLYAVEVARVLAEPPDAASPKTREERRTSRRARKPALIAVPDTLHGVIAARIDSLPASERRLLLSAAVLGHRFRPDALVTIAGGDPAVVRQRVAGLVRRELLALNEELNSPGRGELGFLQALVREVAYRTLARSERRALHLAAARYLESAGDEATEPLAGHLFEAHRLTEEPRERLRLARRAVSALRASARQAMVVHVPDRALDLLERALRLSEGTDERPLVLAEAADAARAAGRLDVAEAHLRELIGLQVAARQRQAAARTRARLASVMLSAQRNAPALEELESALRTVRGWQRDPSGVEIAAQLARAQLLMGEDVEALAWAERALGAARSLALPAIEHDVLVTRGTARLSAGDVERGLADLRDAISGAQEAGSLNTELRARNNLAWSLLDEDPREALRTAREGFELATGMGVGDAAIPLADIACTAAVETGDWEWAITTIDELAERGMTHAFRVVLAATATTIRALRGTASPAAPLDALGPLPPDTDTQVMAAVHQARAWVAFLSGSVEEARRLAADAIAGYVGSDPSYQRALATRASLWLGDLDAARSSLDRLDGPGQTGRAAHATSATMRAGIAALTGDPGAADAYDRAAEAWLALDVPLQRALCLLDRHRLLGGGRQEVGAILGDLGAAGLRRLSRRAAPRRPVRSPRPSVDTARRSGAARRRRPAQDPRSPAG
jgi:class 3 adenylate cyclase/tetratricopeptide (TPR) repeat protein